MSQIRGGECTLAVIGTGGPSRCVATGAYGTWLACVRFGRLRFNWWIGSSWRLESASKGARMRTMDPLGRESSVLVY
eukprot:3514476-Pyramimonas_sp.AAC.2